MDIIREGKRITLTPEELLEITRDEHRKDVEIDVEDEVALQVDEGWISFDSWAECGSEDADADDARTDFIARIVEDILEQEELYDRDPHGYRPDIESLVAYYAKDMGFDRTEEE